MKQPRKQILAVSDASEDSSPKLSDSERDAQTILTKLGLRSQKIATSSEKSADFKVLDDEPSYLIEVKTRLLDERLSSSVSALSQPLTKSMRRDPKVCHWLDEARKQFLPLDPNHERLWFLWCSIENRMGALNQLERTVSVFYGIREMLDVNDPERQTIVVFYADPGAFDRFPEIDGAVVVWTEGGGITFCPNESSPRLEQVMSSKLVRALRENLGVSKMLPRERAAALNENGYVVPDGVRHGDEVQVLRNVQQAFGAPYLTFLALETEYMQTLTVTRSDLESLVASSNLTASEADNGSLDRK